MKCYKCGAELSDDTRFCSYCGVRIEEQFPEMQSSAENETNIQNQVQEESIGQNEVHNMPTDNSQEISVSPIAKETFGDKIKSKLLAFWKSLDGFSKVITVSTAVVVLLLLIAVCTGKGFAIFFSIIQFSGLIVAILMHKNVIKLEAKKKWIKYIILVTAILLSFLNIMSYSWGKDKKPNYDTTYQTQISDTTSPSDIPVITTAKSPYNTDECVGQDYSTIKSAFATAGFTNIKLEKIEDLKLADADKVNAIESVSIGGKTDFIKEQEFDKDEEILIYYHTYEKCNVKIHIDFIPNLIFSKYDVNLLFDGIEKGTIEHGTDKDFEFTVDPGEYLITFESNESSSVKGEVTLLVDSDTEASYKISCHSDEISVKTIAGTTNGTENESTSSEETNAPKITVTMSEDDFMGMLYTDAEAKLREMGFTVFEYKTLETEDINEPDDTIGAVEIKKWEFGKGDFEVGDTYAADAIVVLWYYVCDEPEPNLTVDNCPELAEMLANKAEIDYSYSYFATKYSGKIIEFDGRIDYCTKHGNYDTRFDYLVSAGDYDPDHQIGPAFKFENVSRFDLNTDLDTVSVGLNVHIVAKVVSFDSNSGLFYLDPISVTGR